MVEEKHVDNERPAPVIRSHTRVDVEERHVDNEREAAVIRPHTRVELL